jgi:hypothetical protein
VSLTLSPVISALQMDLRQLLLDALQQSETNQTDSLPVITNARETLKCDVDLVRVGGRIQ